MGKVKVFNLNVHPLKEMFKGEEVFIDSQDYWRDKKGKVKEMDIYEANDYRGQYSPVPFDGSGKMVGDARYYKMLRIEPVDGTEIGNGFSDAIGFKCMAPECKHVSPSSEELEAHSKTRHPGLETLILPEEEAAIKHKKSKAS